MDEISKLLAPPTIKYLHFLTYIIYIMLMFHLTYIGMMLVSTILSVGYRKWKPELSDNFLRLISGNKSLWVILGIIPAVSLALLYKIMLYNTVIPIHLFLLRIMGLLALAFILLYIYIRRGNWIAGAASILVLLGYSFHFIDIEALLIFPEKWFFLKAPIPYPIYYITPLLHFGEFLFISFIITGGWILIYFFKWPETRLTENSPHFDIMKYHGYGLILAGSLPVPVLLLIDLFNLPDYALSIPVFIISAFIIILLSIMGYGALTNLLYKKNKISFFGTSAFILALLLFGLMNAGEVIIEHNSNIESEQVLLSNAEKNWTNFTFKHEGLYAKNQVVDEKMGEQIYKDKCSACHSFDKKVVGPAYNDVLPKYLTKQDELIAFVENPKKINPAFPVMPNPGLSPIQIKSVVKFLMQKISGNAATPPSVKKEEIEKNEPEGDKRD